MSKQDNLDLIFGGHDHKYLIHFEESSSVFLTKSGHDFFDFTNVVMYEGVIEDDAKREDAMSWGCDGVKMR